MPAPDLTLRQKLTWSAHLFKAVSKQHHRELLPLFRKIVGPESIVIDVGAHAGQFSKLFAGLASRGRVYAFEPGAYARSILEPMLRLRRYSNVTVIPAGLSDRPSQATLSVPLKRSGSLGFGLSHLGTGDGLRPERQEEIVLTTLDRFVADARLPRLDLIKADIEGWEVRLLLGAQASIARFRPVLLLELTAGHLARAGDKPADAFDLLLPLGYRAATLAAPEQFVGGFVGDSDYLFLPD